MFDQIRNQVSSRFSLLSKSILFKVDVDKDKIWDIYLNAIPEQYRQSNNCNCCKSFLRQFSGIVAIGQDLERLTLWDFDVESEEYSEAIKALRKYINSLPISGIFLNPFAKLGTNKSPDPKRNVVWTHYYVELPSSFVKGEHHIGPLVASNTDNKNVLKRSLEEITDDAVETVIDLINQGSIYRGNEFLPQVVELNRLKKKYKAIKNMVHKDHFCWLTASQVSGTVCRIRNSAIGTLLQDLSEGKDIDAAVTAFERVTAPANYQRPKSIVTPKMVDAAKARLQELGLTNAALGRRQLTDTDLTANAALFTHRATTKSVDVFDQLKNESVINPRSFSKVEEVSLDDFINKVLPTSKSIRLLLENGHLGNFVSLIGSKDGPESNSGLFKWDNDFSWSYSGQVADSVKERVKAAGGKVDGFLRISLSWLNHDDLDLHVHEPDGNHIYFGNRGLISNCGGSLDVDMNVSSPVRNAVENICYHRLPKDGTYRVVVDNYNRRETTDGGFEVEVECDGETKVFSCHNNNVHHFEVMTFKMKGGMITLHESSLKSDDKGYASKEKWGVKTGQFHKVKAVTLSPNHWNGKVGNRHLFFIIDGCTADEKLRPFYNEFLNESLSKDRKVFEVLGSKVEVEKVENELSGLGFSDTIRNHVILEVEGSFKRVIKVKI